VNRKERRTACLAAVLAATAAITLTACDPFPPGPTGRVVGKASEYHSSTKTRWYFLTTTSKFRVPIEDYNACRVGSAYPKCTEVR
jgi:hypothetical protein